MGVWWGVWCGGVGWGVDGVYTGDTPLTTTAKQRQYTVVTATTATNYSDIALAIANTWSLVQCEVEAVIYHAKLCYCQIKMQKR